MRVPLTWLGEFVDIGVEPGRLAEDLTLAGLAVDAIDKIGAETVLDLDITTNRVDCMNVYGVAREVAALYGKVLRPLDIGFKETGSRAETALAVSIEAPDLCPRFCARVLDVRLGASPQWLRNRLDLVGVRAINNVVDLTNYVMMEMGQPSHAFDLGRLPESRLVVRWARPGETLTTLDGIGRTLGTNVGVVSGPLGPLALAGIMGGASSEVSESTTSVALEAAYWEPLAIRRASRALGMHTEASHRFERGADPEGPTTATARLAHLLEKIGAGTARPGLIDVAAAAVPRRTVFWRPARVATVLGAEVSEEESRRVLTALGFGLGAPTGGAVVVTVPTWRGDVTREVDLVEEVGRHHGLHTVPSSLPPAATPGGLKPFQRTERAIRDVLVGAGLVEVINPPFVSDDEAAPSPGPRLALANPLAEDQGVLRSSLAVPGLLRNLRTNLRHGRRDVRLFEMGRVFSGDPRSPREHRHLAMLLAGPARLAHWSEPSRNMDFFDGKGLLEVLFRRLGVGRFELSSQDLPGFLHPGRSARLVFRDASVGQIGALHPDLAETWELRDETFIAELDLESILGAGAEVARFATLPKYPAVHRDLSVLCGNDVPSAALEQWVQQAGGSLLTAVVVADRYDRPPVPEGKVSLTLTLRYQAKERTLTGEEVQASVEEVVAALKVRGAEIRGE